jgi:hypothetical protein
MVNGGLKLLYGISDREITHHTGKTKDRTLNKSWDKSKRSGKVG